MNTNNKRIHQILPRSVGAKFFFILLIGFTAVISSCNESSVVGLDVQPPGDLLNVGYEDTTTIVTRTIREDSLHTDASVLVTADVLIGKYWDPVFGISSAALYTQLRLPTNSPTFGTNPVCDSVVLSMVYDPVYYGGRARTPQVVNVYPLSQQLSVTADYYSNNTVPYLFNDLAISNSPYGRQFKPNTTDSVMVIGKNQKAQLRIPLENNFGQTILNNQGMSALATNAAFQSLCNGFYITTENTDVVSQGAGSGNIMRFKLGDALSKVTIYYHNSNLTNNDSLRYELPMSSVARFSKFSHNKGSLYANPDLVSQLTTAAPAGGTPTNYIQSLAGTKVKITLPYIEHWRDSGAVAINKAELVIKLDTAAMYQLDTFAAPVKFILFGISDDGSSYPLPDIYEPNQSYDGSYNSTTREYIFNIERYVQQVIMGARPNNGMYLVVSSGAVNANRAVIGGGNASGYTKMKLNLTYTKLH